MTDWVDSLSDAEVAALYKYKQGGVDSLSDDEVKLIYPHKDNLIDTPKPQESFGSKFVEAAKSLPSAFMKGEEVRKGLGEAGLQFASSIPAMVAGPIMGVQARTRGASMQEAGKIAGQQMDAMTFAPRTEKGQEYSQELGDIMNKYIIPIAPMLHGMPAIKASEGVNSVKASLKKAPKETSAPVASAIEAMRTPEVAPDVSAEMFKQEALKKQQLALDEQRQLGGQPITVDSQGRASTLGVTGELVKRTPMEDIAHQLGAEKQSPEAPRTAISDMAKTLEESSTKEQRAAQDVLEARQTELEQAVKKQATLDRNAAERTRQDAADAVSEAHRAFERAKEAARIASDTERMRSATQPEMFEGVNHGYGPNPTDIGGTQHWVKDENGMPIRADLSMEARNLENPLQRNLWGDELAQKHEQEAPSGITQAMDATPDTPFAGDLRDQQTAMLGNPAAITRVGWAKKQGGGIGFGPNTHTSGKPLGERLKDIGHSLITSTNEAISLASKAKDISQGQVGKVINQLTKGGTYLKGKVNHPVVHFTVDRLLDADNVAKAEISTALHGEYLFDLRDLSHAEHMDAFKLLEAADMNQKALTPEFMQKHGIEPKVQKFVMTHQKMMDRALSRINEIRAAVDKLPVTSRVAYSAMNMTGNYRKTVLKPELDNNGKPILNPDGTPKGEVVGVIGANSRTGKVGRSLDKLESAVREKDSSLVFGPLQDMTKRRDVSSSPHAAFKDALEVLGENNPNIQDFLNILREVAKDDVNNYMGLHTHTMQKKGVFGMEGRKPWESPEQNMRDFFDNQVNYLEGVLRWSHLAKAAKDINTVIRDKSVVENHPNAIKLSEEYTQNALGLNPSRFGRGVENVFNTLFSHDIPDSLGIGPERVRKALGFTKAGVNTSMLSLNPSFLGIQLIQGSAAMPAMTAMLRARGLAPSTSGTGYVHMAKGAMALVADLSGMSGKLSPIERGAIQYAKDNHVYATDMVEHTNQIEKGVTYYGTKVTQSPAASIEKATRAQVFMGFVDMMNDAGLSPKDGLYIQAHRMTDMAMNNYGALEKPAVYNALGPIGSMAYNLKSYGHNEISRWAMFAREVPRTGTAVPILTQMATTIAIAGVMGLPFFSQWESVYDTITEKLGTPRSLSMDVMDASNTLGKHVPELGEYSLSHGTPSMLGMDLSKRVGLGDVVASKASDVAFAGGGKLADMVSKVGGAIANPDETHIKAASLTLMPPIIQSIAKEHWYTKGDKVYSMDPDKVKVETAKVTPLDKKLKQWGITGINESVQKESFYQLGKIEKAYSDMRNKAVVQMSNELFTKGTISQATVNKFVKAQGDPSTLDKDIERFAMEQNVTQDKVKILKDAASNSVTRLYDLKRRAK